MGWGEWIAIGGLGLSVLGALGQVIWMLATLQKSVDYLREEQSESSEQIRKHAADCDPDRLQTGFRLAALEGKLAELFK